MRKVPEIIGRAIVLFCLYERCKVELDVYAGKRYSKKEREDQRESICRWIKEKEYNLFLTKEEKDFFQKPLNTIEKHKVNALSHQCECIRPLLWSVGLLKELAIYSGFDDENFGEILQIGSTHSKEELISLCHLRSMEELNLQTEVAMLWHWRTIEIGNVPKDGRSWGDCIKIIFGEEYEEMLSYIPQAKDSPCDFLVGGKPVSELNRTEQQMLDIIAYWRHHAFEWIVGDDEWDEVSADT